METKLFGNCTVEDLRKALVLKRKPSSSKPLPETDMALVQQYRAAVSSKFPESKLAQVSVRNHKGTAIIAFEVPLAEVTKLTEALMDGVPPLLAAS